MQVQVTLTGDTALLMHNDDVMHADRVKDWQKDPANKAISVAGDDRSPAWNWQGYLYRNCESVAMPSANVMTTLRQAAAEIILKKNKTYKELSQAGMMFVDEHLDFTGSDGEKIPLQAIDSLDGDRREDFERHCDAVADLGFTIDIRRVKVGQSKHVRTRPRWEPGWTCTGTLEILDEQLVAPLNGKNGETVLERMFDIAGTRKGLCDWRPGGKTPGPFGKFTAELRELG